MMSNAVSLANQRTYIYTSTTTYRAEKTMLSSHRELALGVHSLSDLSVQRKTSNEIIKFISILSRYSQVDILVNQIFTTHDSEGRTSET